MKTRSMIGFCAFVLIVASIAHAARRESSGTVTQVYSYGDFGGGDFTFRLSSQAQECQHGYWISKSQPGYAVNVAMILQAKATGESIVAGGHDTQLWNGSTGLFCKLDYIGYQ